MKYTVTADLHLRPDTPRCRLDKEWEATMKGMMEVIYDVSKISDSELVIVGDLFDYSQQPPWVVNLFLDTVPNATVFAGNHDFKHRNMNEIEASSIGHILKNPRYKACVPELEDGFFQLEKNILLCHRLVYSPEQSSLAKFKNGISVDMLVKYAVKFNKNVKWIFIGDNHHKFHYKYNDGSDSGIHVINPGSPLIYNASMIGQDCGFYQVDTEKETIKFRPIADDQDILTDQYLRDAEEHSEKMMEFVADLDNPDIKTMDFFELCDEKMSGMPKELMNIYEDIKTETIQIHTKLGKGA